MTPSTPSPESELQQETWELLLEVMSHGERHGLNSDILTPYHTKLLGLIAAHLEAAVRSAKLHELIMREADLNYACGYTKDQPFLRNELEIVRERIEALRRTPDSESENSDREEK